MSVSRDTSKGTWTVYARYTDWQGKVKVLHKRGFKTKREAVEYEREYLLRKSKDVTMGFAQFVECYLEDLKPRLKYNTYLTKEHIIRTKILPYFEDKALADICTSDIMQWQNEILQMRDDDGKGYSPTYLKTISAQMSAIFNHATRYYDLKDNPCQKVGNMGKKKAKEMLFWTRDEFFQFIETMKSKPMSYYAFELLFWTGIREGELLALTREDVDLDKKILHIRKSYQRLERKDVITEPKTEKSNRDINLPDFLCEELEDYFGMLYKCNNDTRLFEVSKHYLQHEMKRGCKESSVKRIRIHDLRHSHVAYLIEGVVPKKNDEHARKRNVCINNRVTPEDRDIIYKRIELSGLTVQDYITECCKYSKVTAVGNVKTFDAIKREMKVIDEHLCQVQRADALDLQVLESLRAILEILNGFYEEEEA